MVVFVIQSDAGPNVVDFCLRCGLVMVKWLDH